MQSKVNEMTKLDRDRWIGLFVETIYHYMDKAKEKGIWGCDVTPDEIQMALVALAELKRQGILDDPEVNGYRQIKEVVRAAVAKSAKCAKVFDEAWGEFWSQKELPTTKNTNGGSTIPKV